MTLYKYTNRKNPTATTHINKHLYLDAKPTQTHPASPRVWKSTHHDCSVPIPTASCCPWHIHHQQVRNLLHFVVGEVLVVDDQIGEHEIGSLQWCVAINGGERMREE